MGTPAELGLDPKALIRELLRAWVLTAVHTGTFHADIHAGNLLAMPDGRLGMLDWGIVAQLDDETQLLMQKLVEASLGDDALQDWGWRIGFWAGAALAIVVFFIRRGLDETLSFKTVAAQKQRRRSTAMNLFRDHPREASPARTQQAAPPPR